MKSYVILGLAALSLGLAPAPAFADCILGAKSSTKISLIDQNTIMLSGGLYGNIVIKTFSFIYNVNSATVLKDNFCDYTSGVMVINDQIINANEVKGF